MKDLKQHEQKGLPNRDRKGAAHATFCNLVLAAIEAVAGQFSATWEKGSDPPDAFLTVAGKRVAVDIVTLKRRGANQSNHAKPRLRFDKVVIRLMERLQATAAENVPDGTTVLVTVTAPILLPAKTALSLEEKIQTLPSRGSLTEQATIHGNLVHIRFLRNQSQRAPKLIGFVHNPDSDPLRLLNMTGELLELIDTLTGPRVPKPVGGRWLIVVGAEGVACLEAYRHIYSQLRIATGFQKILMVFGDGGVGTLAE